MSIQTLKSTFRRTGLLVTAFALVAATFLPAASTYADALNPLTERSLTLSSASPGWSFLDASGNPRFAPPNSGANGNKTGNTFSFRVSSTADVKGISFQYCTTPAGNCMGPGNITGHGANDATAYAAQKSDLEVKTSSPSEVSTFDTKFDKTLGQPASGNMPDPRNNTPYVHPNVPKADNSEGNFIVLTKTPAASEWTQSKGWVMAAEEKQSGGASSNKANYISLVHTGTGAGESSLNIAANDFVKIIFFGTDTNYITNPGDKEFFVKINTHSVNSAAAFDTDPTSGNIIDGGVTVANVMNRSIEIQTKVLETMDFSVGTVDPNTLDSTDPDGADPLLSQYTKATGKAEHGICDPIRQGMELGAGANNVLQLGDENGEFSLRTDTTYSTHSYWRLSSNSSGGATVYYSGVTLSNTVGDQIDAIGKAAKAPSIGSEQFGLALDNNTTGDREVSYAKERTAAGGTQQSPTGGIFQNGADNAVTGVHATLATDALPNASWHAPRLAPLSPIVDATNSSSVIDYSKGKGNVNSSYGAIDTKFAFDAESTVVPTPFAQGTEVLDCVTGKMRYIANIAATTPAGVYTTKINYIAAPKY